MNQGAAGQQAAGGRTLRPAAAAAAHRPAAWHLLHLLFGCPHTLPSPPCKRGYRLYGAVACTPMPPLTACLPALSCRDLSTGDAIRIYSGHHKATTTCALNDSAIEGRDDG